MQNLNYFISNLQNASISKDSYLYKDTEGNYHVAKKGFKKKNYKKLRTKEIIKIAKKALNEQETDKESLKNALSNYKSRLSKSIEKKWWYFCVIRYLFPIKKIVKPIQKLIDQIESKPVKTSSPKRSIRTVKNPNEIPLSEAQQILSAIRAKIDTSPVSVKKPLRTRTSQIDRDILFQGKKKEELAAVGSKHISAIETLCKESFRMDRGVGALTGLTIGDVAGAPLEFEEVRTDTEKDSPYSLLDSGLYSDSDGENRPHRFGLKQGQWTDDSAMAFCLADGLLARGREKLDHVFADTRARWHTWWHHGYNNAFRFKGRKDGSKGSIGLGGNISKSLESLKVGGDYRNIPSRVGPGRDAGNGSLMRLAPIVIAHLDKNISEAADAAERSSFASHPGKDAALACRFLAYMIHQGANRSSPDETPSEFTERVIKKFLNDHEKQKGEEMTRLRYLLQKSPSSQKEELYRWNAEDLGASLKTSVKSRGNSYNGYPVSRGYFGSYSLDALAMSLWAFTHAKDFDNAILKAVNLLGDADTVGAITGQMAGAFFGYRAQTQSKVAGKILDGIRTNDPAASIQLRAALLVA